MSKYVYPENRLPSADNSKLLALVGEKKEVLEVGCGLGYHSRAMKEQQNCKVTGIEIDATAAEQAKPHCEKLIVGDIETLNLNEIINGTTFDVVTFADVLEHLRNPADALRRVHPFINIKGYLVASIPNITHSSVLFELARGRFHYRSLGLLDDTHIRFFSRESIFDMFETAGYQIVALERNRVSPRSTEFETQPETQEDRQFLRYLTEHNPDADTYQFIVKALPTAEPQHHLSEVIAAHDTIRLLQLDAKLNQNKIRELSAQIDVFRSSLVCRIIEKLKRK